MNQCLLARLAAAVQPCCSNRKEAQRQKKQPTSSKAASISLASASESERERPQNSSYGHGSLRIAAPSMGLREALETFRAAAVASALTQAPMGLHVDCPCFHGATVNR